MTGLFASGIEARCVVVDASVLGPEALWRPIDADFVAGLPASADPAGELGEYHSLVVDAPFFSAPLEMATGEPVCIESVVGTTDGPQTFRWWALPTWLAGTPEPQLP